jgi:hypothetical protein
MTHVPPPIEQNQVHRDLQTTETLLRQTREGRHHALVITGPPGIGKSHMCERLAVEYGEVWSPERPGTALGMMMTLREYSGVSEDDDGELIYATPRTLHLDDLDHVYKKTDIIQVLMAALDTKPHRYLNHKTGTNAFGNTTSITRFEITCPVIFLTNLDFNDPKFLKQHGMAALKSRALISPISHDALALYEFTGHLATEGGMLDSIRVDFPIGRIVHRDGEDPITVTKRNRRWRLNLAEKTDVLVHFQQNAARYPSISPRELYKYARMRVGEPKLIWERMVDAQLLNKPRWTSLPADLHRYRIERV